MELGRVDDAGRAGAFAGRRGAEAGLGTEAFDPGGKGARGGLVKRLFLGFGDLVAVAGPGTSPGPGPGDLGVVERHFGVGDLVVVVVEDAERIAVASRVQALGRMGDDDFAPSVVSPQDISDR